MQGRETVESFAGYFENQKQANPNVVKEKEITCGWWRKA